MAPKINQAAISLLLIITLVLCIIPVQMGKAQTENTITVPDDYPTISAAIGNASNGDTIHVKSGTYFEEQILINKTISLEGEDNQDTIIVISPYLVRNEVVQMYGIEIVYSPAPPLQIEANNVKLSNFNITIINGTSLIYGDGAQIINNNINTNSNSFRLEGNHQAFAQNNVQNTSIQCYGSYNTIAGNNLKGNGIKVRGEGSSNAIYGNILSDGNGIGMINDENRIFNNTVINCSQGVGVGGYGSNNIIYRNIVINNTRGLNAGGLQGTNNVFYANTAINNTYGARSTHYLSKVGESIYYQNNFIDNTEQVYVDSTVYLSGQGNFTAYHYGTFDNGQVGNYWSTYPGTDTNGDGIGDSPYVIDANRSDNYPLMEPFDISSVSLDLPDWAYILPSPTPENVQDIAPAAANQTPTAFTLDQNAIILIILTAAAVALAAFAITKKRAQ
jgi:nitrous oxidase accessory protein NosD